MRPSSEASTRVRQPLRRDRRVSLAGASFYPAWRASSSTPAPQIADHELRIGNLLFSARPATLEPSAGQ